MSFQTVDGKTLTGYWWPSENPSGKTMVLGHGYYSGPSTLYTLGNHLRKSGWNVFLFNLRGQGQSEHEPVSLGYHEGKDIAAAVNFVKKHFPAQAETLYYLGHSMGAAAMLMTPESLRNHPDALAQLERQVDGIILDSPFNTVDIADDKYVQTVSNFQPGLKPLQRPWAHIQPRLKRFLERYTRATETQSQEKLRLPVTLKTLETGQIFSASPMSRKPILLLHGRQDTRVPEKHTRIIFNTLNQQADARVQRVILEADHRDRTAWHPDYKYVRFNTILRDEPQYLAALKEFLPD